MTPKGVCGGGVLPTEASRPTLASNLGQELPSPRRFKILGFHTAAAPSPQSPTKAAGRMRAALQARESSWPSPFCCKSLGSLLCDRCPVIPLLALAVGSRDDAVPRNRPVATQREYDRGPQDGRH